MLILFGLVIIVFMIIGIILGHHAPKENAKVHQIWWNSWSHLSVFRWGFALRVFWFRVYIEFGNAVA